MSIADLLRHRSAGISLLASFVPHLCRENAERRRERRQGSRIHTHALMHVDDEMKSDSFLFFGHAQCTGIPPFQQVIGVIDQDRMLIFRTDQATHTHTHTHIRAVY